MKRDVSCHLELSADGPAELVFSVAVARGVPVVSESLSVTSSGALLEPVEQDDQDPVVTGRNLPGDGAGDVRRWIAQQRGSAR